jgi:2-polyprenyl-3-methyl-5-hydroxy-6-metoxy-1,4-benzoquinol methylase
MNEKYEQVLLHRPYQTIPQLKYERRTSVDRVLEFIDKKVHTIEDIIQAGFALGVLKYEDIYGKRALDLGTGSGCGARALKAYGTRVIGLDVEENYLKGAIKFCKLKPEEVVLAEATDYLASQPPASFDVITAFQVMQRLYGRGRFNRFYDLCLRALTPNGIIVFSYGDDVNSDIEESKAEGTFAKMLHSNTDPFVFFGRKLFSVDPDITPNKYLNSSLSIRCL